MHFLGEEIVSLLRVDSRIDGEQLDKSKWQELKWKGKWKVLPGPAARHNKGHQSPEQGAREARRKAKNRSQK